MRIATLVISLCLTMIIGLQSCAVGIGGNLLKDNDMSGGGAVGVLVAFLFVIGAAFSIGLPTVSMIAFGIAAAFGFAVGQTTAFHDMTIWGGVAAVLAIMSYFGRREKSRKTASL